MTTMPAKVDNRSVAGLTLRAAGIFDANLLATMHAASFRESWDRPWSRKSFAEILALPGAVGLIAARESASKENPEPVGFGLTLASGEEAELLLLAVLPAWRRHGIAQRLLLALLHHAARGGANRALLEVAAANAPAIACYERVGFTICGRRPNYYAPGVDAILYERFLQEGSIRQESQGEPGNKCE